MPLHDRYCVKSAFAFQGQINHNVKWNMWHLLYKSVNICLQLRSVCLHVFISIQIEYGLPYYAICPSVSTEPGSGEDSYPGGGIPGTVRILGQLAQIWQNIFKLYCSTGSWKLYSCPFTGILCQREVVSISWKQRPVTRSPAHNTLLLQLQMLLHLMTQADMKVIQKRIQ